MPGAGCRVLENDIYLLYCINPKLIIMKKLILIIAAVLLVNICFAQDQLARARADKEWGYIKTEGKWVINPQF